MNYIEAKKRLLEAQNLLLEPTTSLEKFISVRKLIEGIHPRLDNVLHECDRALSTVRKVFEGGVISLSAENLPEQTEEEKHRKKALIFFLNTWNKLKGEVARVQAELNAADSTTDATEKTSHWTRIFNFAKGPFGIITIAAAGIVLTMNATSVKITIYNEGCGTMVPSSSIPISIPGLSFPKDPIPSGGSAVAILPGLPLNVDGTRRGTLVASALKFTMTFQLGSISDVTFDDVSLLGKKTDVRLGDKKEHDLSFICR